MLSQQQGVGLVTGGHSTPHYYTSEDYSQHSAGDYSSYTTSDYSYRPYTTSHRPYTTSSYTSYTSYTTHSPYHTSSYTPNTIETKHSSKGDIRKKLEGRLRVIMNKFREAEQDKMAEKKSLTTPRPPKLVTWVPKIGPVERYIG